MIDFGGIHGQVHRTDAELGPAQAGDGRCSPPRLGSERLGGPQRLWSRPRLDAGVLTGCR
jgi:hypothetical protein